MALERGIYDTQYFSGAQCSVFIGDVWVDEITSITLAVQQSKSPLYGYADEYYRDVARGQVIVNGEFSINFKEAGYLYLVLKRYRDLKFQPSKQLNASHDKIIEEIVNANTKSFKARNQYLKNIASLQGYAADSFAKQADVNRVYRAFEKRLWDRQTDSIDREARRTDIRELNGFDIYVAFGDHTDANAHSTVQKIEGVHITGVAKMVASNGDPIQESYSFFARNII